MRALSRKPHSIVMSLVLFAGSCRGLAYAAAGTVAGVRHAKNPVCAIGLRASTLLAIAVVAFALCGACAISPAAAIADEGGLVPGEIDALAPTDGASHDADSDAPKEMENAEASQAGAVGDAAGDSGDSAGTAGDAAGIADDASGVAGGDAGAEVAADGQGEGGGSASRVQMHRLYNSYTGEHFYTADEAESDSLMEAGWDYEGVAWEAPEQSEFPVLRLYNPVAGDHHYTRDEGERDALVDAGWTYEGEAWCSDEAEGMPLYRLYNAFAASGAHHYTASHDEYISLVSRGWIPEGVAWYGCAADVGPDGEQHAGGDEGAVDDAGLADGAELASPDDAAFVPVYRLYCPATGDHVYTSAKDERDSLASWVWHYEGAAWRAAPEGDPVYRLSNPSTEEHVFTASAEESGVLVREGWSYEGVAFASCAESDGASIPVFRLYNAASGLHHYTADEQERDALAAAGWVDEGTAWRARPLADGFEDDLALWEPRISGDAGFDEMIERILYYHGSLRAAFEYVAGFPYRSGNRFFSGPRYLDDATTMDFACDMAANHSGNCYRYASLFCWLARGLGYGANVVSGWVPTYSNSHDPHGWTEVYIDGQTYICDPDMVQFYRGTNWYLRTYDSPPTNYGTW